MAEGSGAPGGTRRLFLVLAVLAALAAALWWAGGHIRSTKQATASAQPPAPAIITVGVESRVVSATLTLAGAVSSGAAQSIVAPTLGGSVSAVVTHVSVSAGNSVRQGDLVADVSGRPVMVLMGSFPMYRPLSPGDRGPDVAELQSGLRQVGNFVGDTPGVFGPSTLAALERLYRKNGYLMETQPGVAADPGAGPPSTPTTPPSAVPVLPVGEIDYVAGLPALVAAVQVPVGAIGQGQPILTLTTGALSFDANIGAAGPSDLKAGLPAVVTVQGAPTPFPATVTGISATTAATASTAGSTPGGGGVLTLTPAGAVPPALAGETASIVITLSQTTGPVLAVPLSAVGSACDGTAVLDVVAGGRIEAVPVRTGQIGGGYVQILDPPAGVGVGTKVAVGSGPSGAG